MIPREAFGSLTRSFSHRVPEAGFSTKERIARRKSLTLPLSTRRPLVPSSIISGIPPPRVEITGVPLAIASGMIIPNGSDHTEGATMMSAEA